MYEYEFRIVAVCDRREYHDFYEIARSLLKGDFRLFSKKSLRVFYVKPHFRIKETQAPEWKRVLSTRTVYRDTIWFKFVESEEIPYRKWSKQLAVKYLQNTGHYSHPISIEFRHELTFETVKLYAYRKLVSKKPQYGWVFEFETGTFDKRQPNLEVATLSEHQLGLYKRFYRLFRNRPPPPHLSSRLSLECVRKPVIPLHPLHAKRLLASSGSVLLTAPKHDGTFGFVHTHPLLREVWEDNVHRVYHGNKFTLGEDEAVFGAERLPDGSVVLLDVYRMRGSPVRTTLSLLTEFLPSLKLPLGLPYRVQTYRVLDSTDRLIEKDGCDGIILHDVTSDVVYKVKSKHTIDLVHYDGYFWMSTGEKIKVPSDEHLLNGSVYECDLDTFVPLRRRDDRFVGNSAKQIEQLKSAALSPP